MRRVVFLLELMVCLGVAHQTANACMCGGEASACDAYGSATAVFVGTVSGVREKEQPKSVEQARREERAGLTNQASRAFVFWVEQSYLGVPTTEVEIFTERSTCEYPFKIGERYLVYAHQSGTNLITSTCTRTKRFSEANEDLAFLGTLSSASSGVTIHGRIARWDSKKEVGISGPDILVTIDGEETKDVRPDNEGNFNISGLRAGKYTVKVHLPDTLTTYQAEKELTVADRGCASQVWYVTDNGEVSGRVVDAEGRGVAKILVMLVKPNEDPRTAKDYRVESTDADGRFKISPVPTGKYVIAVNFNRNPTPTDSTNAYPPTFYPGVLDHAQAEVITVGLGEKIINRLIRVPLRRAESLLSGQVVWADGSAVSMAQILVGDITYRDTGFPMDQALQADEQGRFSIKGYVGQRILLFARSNRQFVLADRPNDPIERSFPVRLQLQQPTETVKIVITNRR